MLLAFIGIVLQKLLKSRRSLQQVVIVLLMTALTLVFITRDAIASGAEASVVANNLLEWKQLPDLPNELGVAGPFVGVHGDALIVAGGANFPRPVWGNGKVWHDAVYVLTKANGEYQWQLSGKLPRPIAYGAAVSTPAGIVCLGGNDEANVFDTAFLLAWDADTEKLTIKEYPTLPKPCAYGQATLLDEVIYLAGGQSGAGIDSAMKNFWALNLSQQHNAEAFAWQELKPWPGDSRAFNITTRQHNGYVDCVYVIGGRKQKNGEELEFLSDAWEYAPTTRKWRRRADTPRPVVAGLGIGFGQSHIFVLGGADGSLFYQADVLKDDHPGFPTEALAYHTITNTWSSAGRMPKNHVTTVPVLWNDRIVIASGEVRPRVRSPTVWSIAPTVKKHGFGLVNYSVLFGYLAAMVCLGVYFARRNKNTDDFFRGGKRIPWWAAGCSIFATMLSSLTYTGIPSKAYAQDWVYAVGSLMIPLVAIFAVFVALPLYRRIDATSAYEYLEQRFSRSVRLFGSASFTLFHLFRMAVVMSLTGLALAVATPLGPAQSVLLMGVLSIIYCSMGGIEAVIWTDTIQTFILLGGALLALAFLVTGVDGGWAGLTQAAAEADKFRIVNTHFDPTNARLALWVVILGALGQNVSSYTADQAVVQRYMTTADEQLAARSIWTNAVMATFATFLFFGIGTALFAYYHSHPSKLDPMVTTDQIFPLFIANEMPIGIAGLIVAGLFSAAQSTVSTSMNSIATTIVTDFMRPFDACKTERGYLLAARLVTLLIGILGTLLGLVFVNPQIKSLFDTFIMVIGLSMGVLGGLFLLGLLTKRTNTCGAMAGATIGVAVMFWLWRFTSINGYLYTTCGIVTCVIVGYLASFFGGSADQETA